MPPSTNLRLFPPQPVITRTTWSGKPPTSIQESAEKQMRADRGKRATILQGDGQKQAALLKAETECEVAAILARGSEATRSTPQSPVRASPVAGHQPPR